MEILYISSAYSESSFDSYIKTMKKQKKIYGMPVAANKFHNLVIKGLTANSHNVYAITGRPISQSTHDNLWFSKYKDTSNCGADFYYLPFINLPIIKYLFIGVNCMIQIIKWKIKNRGLEKRIIYDASYVTIIPFIIVANLFFKSSTTAIFMDIYNYMSDTTAVNKMNNWSTSLIRKIMTFCYNKTDKYVFLSKKMNNLINKSGKPFVIIEGIADSYAIKNNREKIKSNSNKKVILYGGALKEEYGIKILLEGFQLYENDNVELCVFGEGDYVEQILKFQKEDSRIKYCGSVDNEAMIIEEIKADLLVNPRPSTNEFVLYSFPSKIMEYMSSGTAVLSTKLPTIPKEYKEHLLFIEDESAIGIRDMFIKIFDTHDIDIDLIGKLSKEFIVNNKNEMVQAKKIME